MQELVVIRMVGGELFWYPPGSAGVAHRLDPALETEALAAGAAAPAAGAAAPTSGAEAPAAGAAAPTSGAAAPTSGAEALAAVAAARRAPLAFAVPGADLALREVPFGRGERRHVAASLPFILEDEFAADIDTLHFASRRLGRASMGVAACARERMAEWSRRLASLPDLPLWIPEPLLLPWRPGELCLVAEADLLLARHGPGAGFGVERELAPALLRALDDSEDFNAVILHGQDQPADEALLPPRLRQRAQWRRGGFGAALMLSGGARHALNLRQGEFGAKLPLARWRRQWRPAAALAAAAFSLHLAATWVDYRQLQATNLELRRAVEAAYRSAAPQGALVDPERQLRRQLAAARGGAGGPGFTALLHRVGQALRSEPGARLAAVSFNGQTGAARLNVVAVDFLAVERIRTRMEAAGLEALLETSNAQGETVRARFRVRERDA